jgi:hypothetical protein
MSGPRSGPPKRRCFQPALCPLWPNAKDQSDKISHIDIEDDHIDTVISYIISSYPISISRMTISLSDHILSLWRKPGASSQMQKCLSHSPMLSLSIVSGIYVLLPCPTPSLYMLPPP